MIQIRLKRISSKRKLLYYIVVLQRHKASSRGFLEKLGSYTPSADKVRNKYVLINLDRTLHWLGRGAVLNPSVYTLIKELLENR